MEATSCWYWLLLLLGAWNKMSSSPLESLCFSGNLVTSRLLSFSLIFPTQRRNKMDESDVKNHREQGQKVFKKSCCESHTIINATAQLHSLLVIVWAFVDSCWRTSSFLVRAAGGGGQGHSDQIANITCQSVNFQNHSIHSAQSANNYHDSSLTLQHLTWAEDHAPVELLPWQNMWRMIQKI